MRGTVLACVAATLTAYAGAAVAQPDIAVGVEAAGSVAGLTGDRLTTYLARHMQQAAPAGWHFHAATGPGANRVVWSLRQLRIVWPGGGHGGTALPSHAETYYAAEVKLYLNGQYETTVLRHPTIRSVDDRALDDLVAAATRLLLSEASPPAP